MPTSEATALSGTSASGNIKDGIVFRKDGNPTTIHAKTSNGATAVAVILFHSDGTMTDVTVRNTTSWNSVTTDLSDIGGFLAYVTYPHGSLQIYVD